MTRPQALQETFEGCADIVVAKLLSYMKQAEDYHNQCLQGNHTSHTHTTHNLLSAKLPASHHCMHVSQNTWALFH